MFLHLKLFEVSNKIRNTSKESRKTKGLFRRKKVIKKTESLSFDTYQIKQCIIQTGKPSYKRWWNHLKVFLREF